VKLSVSLNKLKKVARKLGEVYVIMAGYPEVSKEKINQLKDTLGATGTSMLESMSKFMLAASATALSIVAVGKVATKEDLQRGGLVIGAIAVVAVIVSGLVLVLSKFIGARKMSAAADALSGSAQVIMAAGVAGMAAALISRIAGENEIRAGVETIGAISFLMIGCAALIKLLAGMKPRKIKAATNALKASAQVIVVAAGVGLAAALIGTLFKTGDLVEGVLLIGIITALILKLTDTIQVLGKKS